MNIPKKDRVYLTVLEVCEKYPNKFLVGSHPKIARRPVLSSRDSIDAGAGLVLSATAEVLDGFTPLCIANTKEEIMKEAAEVLDASTHSRVIAYCTYHNDINIIELGVAGSLRYDL